MRNKISPGIKPISLLELKPRENPAMRDSGGARRIPSGGSRATPRVQVDLGQLRRVLDDAMQKKSAATEVGTGGVSGEIIAAEKKQKKVLSPGEAVKF